MDTEPTYYQRDSSENDQHSFGVVDEVEQDTQHELESKGKKRARHGARNQHRHKHVVKWIISTFPHAINLALDDESSPTVASSDQDNKLCESEENDKSSSQMHILDIAGGKGELATRLAICHRVNVKIVDPRPADILDCFHKLVFRSLPKKWQQKITSQDPGTLKNAVNRRFQQFVTYFPSDSDSFTCLAQLHENQKLLEAVRNSSLLIGMHSDGATEAIVDVAMHYRKPFVVVPCCVFPNLFQNRFIPRYDKENMSDELKHEVVDVVPVRSHEQFCRYLLLKDSHFVMEELPFEGRNVAIWWDGNRLDADEQNNVIPQSII